MGKRTEDEFLRRRQHVQAECDLVLVLLPLRPPCDRRAVGHEEGDEEDHGAANEGGFEGFGDGWEDGGVAEAGWLRHRDGKG